MAVFQIYKRDQGKFVRWGTVGGIAVLVGIGMYWLSSDVLAGISNLHIGSMTIPKLYIQTIVVCIFGAAGILGGLYVVNKPSTAEFMIMTESEMRKVHWPSRKEVLASTRVVVVLTLFFAFMLAAVDWGFIKFFELINLLK